MPKYSRIYGADPPLNLRVASSILARLIELHIDKNPSLQYSKTIAGIAQW